MSSPNLSQLQGSKSQQIHLPYNLDEPRKKPQIFYAYPKPTHKPNLKKYTLRTIKNISSKRDFIQDPLCQYRNSQGVAIAPSVHMKKLHQRITASNPKIPRRVLAPLKNIEDKNLFVAARVFDHFSPLKRVKKEADMRFKAKENMLQKEQEPQVEPEIQGILNIMNGQSPKAKKQGNYGYSNTLERLNEMLPSRVEDRLKQQAERENLAELKLREMKSYRGFSSMQESILNLIDKNNAKTKLPKREFRLSPEKVENAVTPNRRKEPADKHPLTPAEIKEKLETLNMNLATQRLLEANQRPDSDFVVKEIETQDQNLKPYIDEQILLKKEISRGDHLGAYRYIDDVDFDIFYLTPHQKFPVVVRFTNVMKYIQFLREVFQPDQEKHKQARLDIMCWLACAVKRFLQLKRAPLNFFDDRGKRIYNAEQIIEYISHGNVRSIFCQVSQRFYKDISASTRLSEVSKTGRTVQIVERNNRVNIVIDLATKDVSRELENFEKALRAQKGKAAKKTHPAHSRRLFKVQSQAESKHMSVTQAQPITPRQVTERKRTNQVTSPIGRRTTINAVSSKTLPSHQLKNLFEQQKKHIDDKYQKYDKNELVKRSMLAYEMFLQNQSAIPVNEEAVRDLDQPTAVSNHEAQQVYRQQSKTTMSFLDQPVHLKIRDQTSYSPKTNNSCSLRMTSSSGSKAATQISPIKSVPSAVLASERKRYWINKFQNSNPFMTKNSPKREVQDTPKIRSTAEESAARNYLSIEFKSLEPISTEVFEFKDIGQFRAISLNTDVDFTSAAGTVERLRRDSIEDLTPISKVIHKNNEKMERAVMGNKNMQLNLNTYIFEKTAEQEVIDLKKACKRQSFLFMDRQKQSTRPGTELADFSKTLSKLSHHKSPSLRVVRDYFEDPKRKAKLQAQFYSRQASELIQTVDQSKTLRAHTRLSSNEYF